jgi:hypothetical protein
MCSPVYRQLMKIRYVSRYLGHDTIHITIRYDTSVGATLVLLCVELNDHLVVVGLAGPRSTDAWCRRICICIFVVFPQYGILVLIQRLHTNSLLSAFSLKCFHIVDINLAEALCCTSASSAVAILALFASSPDRTQFKVSSDWSILKSVSLVLCRIAIDGSVR